MVYGWKESKFIFIVCLLGDFLVILRVTLRLILLGDWALDSNYRFLRPMIVGDWVLEDSCLFLRPKDVGDWA